jgi:hypothetical protein
VGTRPDVWIVFRYKGEQAIFAGVFAEYQQAIDYADKVSETFAGDTFGVSPYTFGDVVF